MEKVKNAEKLLEIKNLEVYFNTKKGKIPIISNINFEVLEKRTLGIVGESGSGKSVTALSIMKLLPEKIAAISKGSIKFKGTDITLFNQAQMQKIRGKNISMIFQDPLTSLNPSVKIKTQLTEGILLDKKMSKREALDYSINLLKKLGIPDPSRRINDYPFQFSGGMQQRVMIAIAISRNPSLLIADEPTTALDVSVQNQILVLLKELKDEFNMGLIIISHDMGVIAKTCDEVLIMYAGKIMELGESHDIFYNTKHPYTKALLNSIPKLDKNSRTKLKSIDGSSPEIEDAPLGCRFHPRCDQKLKICCLEEPGPSTNTSGHLYYCWNPIR